MTIRPLLSYAMRFCAADGTVTLRPGPESSFMYFYNDGEWRWLNGRRVVDHAENDYEGYACIAVAKWIAERTKATSHIRIRNTTVHNWQRAKRALVADVDITEFLNHSWVTIRGSRERGLAAHYLLFGAAERAMLEYESGRNGRERVESGGNQA